MGDPGGLESVMGLGGMGCMGCSGMGMFWGVGFMRCEYTGVLRHVV